MKNIILVASFLIVSLLTQAQPLIVILIKDFTSLFKIRALKYLLIIILFGIGSNVNAQCPAIHPVTDSINALTWTGDNFTETYTSTSISNTQNINSAWNSKYSNQSLSLPITLSFSANATSGFMFGLVPSTSTKPTGNWTTTAYSWGWNSGGDAWYDIVGSATQSYISPVGIHNYQINISATGVLTMYYDGILKKTVSNLPITSYNLAQSDIFTSSITNINWKGYLKPTLTASKDTLTCAVPTANLSSFVNTGLIPAGLRVAWSLNNPPNNASDTITAAQIAAISTAGTYYAFYDSATCRVGVSDSLVVTTSPKPNAGVDQTVCQNTTATMAATPGASFVWSAAVGNPATATITTPTSATTTITGLTVAGTYNFVWKNPATGCTDTAAVIVNPLPTISGTLNVCKNSTTTLAGSRTPATTNPWVSGTTSVATVSSTGVVTGVAAGTSVITYTNSNGCSTTATVTVNALPTISGTLTICANPTTVLTGSGTAAASNAWVSGTTSVATVNLTTTTGTVTGVAAGTTLITYTDNNGCSATSTVTNNQPTITGALALCVGSSTILTGSVTAAASNAWVSGTTSVATVNSTTTTGTVVGVVAGSSIITYTNTAGCKKTVTVVVGAKTTSTTNTSICSTSLPYSWNGLTFNAAGTQTAHILNSVGCDSAATLNLTIKPTSTSTTNTTICSTSIPYSWNGLTFNAAGSQTAHLINSVGCDNAATLNLTVKAASTSTVSQTVCISSLPYVWHGTSYNAAGAYVYHTNNAVGCDSAVTLNLTVTPAGTWVGGATGNWSVAANWCPAIPTSSTNVVIPSGTIVTIDTASAFANTVDIKSGGGLIMSGTKDLTIVSGGTFNNSGTFNASASTGAVVFGGSGTISGTTTFNNIKTSGALDFGTSSSIAGTFSLLPGGSVTGHSPTYICPTAILAYKTKNSFTRGLEWTTASSGAGYPANIYVQDSTTLNVGAAGAGYICYDLQIDSLSKFDQSAGGSTAIHIGRNVTIKGTLTLGTAVGGDISLGGSWTRNAGGIFNHYDRKVTFDGPANFSGNGTSISTIFAPDSTNKNNEGGFGGENFAHLWMNKTSVSDQVKLLSNITIDKEIKFIKGTFNTNASDVTIVSDLLHTADVAKVVTPSDVVVTYGSGRFVIQRFIQNQSTQRTWRFLTSPLQYSDPLTINNAWQEAQVNPDKTTPMPTNPWPAVSMPWCGLNLRPGFGTHITGPGGTFNGGVGFDQGTNTYSVEWFNNTGTTNAWAVPASTTGTALMSKLGWGLFVRGDRGFVIGDQYVPGANAILEPKGKINVGDVTVPTSMLVAGKYNLIGNPYASQINMTNVDMGGAIQQQYKLWDPKAFTNYVQTGKYVNFTYVSGTTYAYTNVGTTWQYPGTIESSEAFLATPATTEVVFHETDKIDLVSTLNGIQSRSANTQATVGPIAFFRTDLAWQNPASGKYSIIEGTINMYNPSYNTVVTGNEDAISPTNAKSLGVIRILKDAQQLSISKEQPIGVNDTIFLFISPLMAETNHKLAFSNVNFDANLQAVLIDKYLNTRTSIAINNTDTTFYPFTVSATDAQSNRSDRFMVVFKPFNTTPVKFTNVIAAANNNESITVKWNVASEINAKQYIVERSNDGIHFESITVTSATNNSNYNWLDANAGSGENYYRIVSVSNDGAKQYSAIVKATIANAVAAIHLISNPIINNTIALEFKNAETGDYKIKLTNQLGQTILHQSLKINAANTIQKIATQSLPSAVYDLELSNSKGVNEVLKVIVP